MTHRLTRPAAQEGAQAEAPGSCGFCHNKVGARGAGGLRLVHAPPGLRALTHASVTGLVLLAAWPPLPFYKMQEGIMEGGGDPELPKRCLARRKRSTGWTVRTVRAPTGRSGGGRPSLPGLGEGSQPPPSRLPRSGSRSRRAPLSHLARRHIPARGCIRGRWLWPSCTLLRVIIPVAHSSPVLEDGLDGVPEKHFLQIFSSPLPPQPRCSFTPPGPVAQGAFRPRCLSCPRAPGCVLAGSTGEA